MADLSKISNQELLSALSDDDLLQIANQSKDSFVDKTWEGAKQVGKNIIGMAENAANQASVLGAMTVTAVPNIIGSAAGEVTEAIVNERMPTLKGVSDKFHKNIEAQVYQPVTESGQQQVAATGEVLTAIPRAVDAVDTAIGDTFKRNYPNAYAATQVAGEFAPFVVAGKAVHGAKAEKVRSAPGKVDVIVDPAKLAENRRAVPVEDMPVEELQRIAGEAETNKPKTGELTNNDLQSGEAPQVTWGQPSVSPAAQTEPRAGATSQPEAIAVQPPTAEYPVQPKFESPTEKPAVPVEALSESTSIKNATVEAERIAAGKDPLESKIIRLVPSVEAGKNLVESGKIDPRQLAKSLTETPRPIDAAEVGVLLHDRIKIKNELKQTRTAIEEARQSGDTAAEVPLKERLSALEDAYDINDRASRSAGTEQSAAFRARQLIERDDYSYENVIQRVKAQGDGTVPEATRAKIDELTKRLEAVTKEAETQAEKIANLEADFSIKQIAREERIIARKGTRKAKAERLDVEFSDLTKELNSILNPNRVSMNLDPQAVVVITKMARNRVKKGMLKSADVVDDIYNTIGGVLDKRDIAKVIADMSRSERSARKADAVDRKIQAETNDLKRQIEAEIKPVGPGRSIRNMAVEAWKSGLLSGPKTHIVNITSNALTLAGKPVETVFAAGIDRVRSGARGERQQRFVREAAAEVVGFRAGVSEGMRRAARAWAEALPDTEAQKFNESQNAHAIPGRVGKAIRIPFRALGAADSFFKAINESSEIYREAYRRARVEGLSGKQLEGRIAEIVADPPGDLMDMAKKEADYRTFNQEMGPAGKWVGKSKELPFVGMLAELLLPFIRTPLNIAKFGLERTPINYGRILYKALRKELAGTELTKELAKPAIGTLITVGVANLVMDDKITGGGPKGKAAREALYRTGWQPYSIKIGDNYYSYNRFEPIGMIFGTTADFVELVLNRDERVKNVVDGANLVAMSIAKNWTSKTFLKGFSDAINALEDPARYGQQFINGYAGSLIPSAVNTVVQASDPYRRDIRGLGDTMASRVPGLSEGLPEKLDLWGRPIKKAGLNVVDRAISPVAISPKSDDFVDNEMVRLGLHPGAANRKIYGNELTPEQYNEYVQLAGQRAYPQVLNILQSVYSDDLKKRQVIYVISKTREMAKHEMMNKYGFQKKHD